mgnify:CR=1 FL=1
MKRGLFTILGSVVCLALAAPAFAQTHVYAGESIQDAISSVASGATIIVHNGSYYADPEDFGKISFQGKNITLIAASGPDSTTIWNAQLTLTGGESRACRIEGFTLRATVKRATNGTFVVCDRAERAAPVALVVSYTGRPRTADADRRGNPYACAD